MLLFACSAGPPVQEMSDARQAIAAAREAGAEDLAAEDFRAAEAFLDSAQRNLSERAYGSARRKRAKHLKFPKVAATKISLSQFT